MSVRDKWESTQVEVSVRDKWESTQVEVSVRDKWEYCSLDLLLLLLLKKIGNARPGEGD